MKVPSSRTLRRTLAALTFTAALALTGCSDDQAASSGGSDAGGQPPAASDGGGGPLAGGEGGAQRAPEADVSDVPDVVATVNGQEITKDEFISVYESQFQQMAMQQQTTGEEVDEAALKNQVAEPARGQPAAAPGRDRSGIDGDRRGYRCHPRGDRAQNGLGSADEVSSALEQQDMDEKDVRNDAASQFTADLLSRAEERTSRSRPTRSSGAVRPARRSAVPGRRAAEPQGDGQEPECLPSRTSRTSSPSRPSPSSRARPPRSSRRISRRRVM